MTSSSSVEEEEQQDEEQEVQEVGSVEETEAAEAEAEGDSDELTKAERGILLRGKCVFLLLMLLSTVAFVQSGFAVGYCDFASRHVTLAPGVGTPQQACNDLLNFQTDWRGQICQTFFDEHGVGFYGWYFTTDVESEQIFCTSYELWVTNVGIVTPQFDSTFYAARVFAVLAAIFGSFGCFTLLFSTCCPLDSTRLKGLSCYFMLAYICQAFTFLLLASNVCQAGFLAQYFQGLNTTTNNTPIVENVHCSLGRGGIVAVSATCLYFVCSLLVPWALPPMPIMGYHPPTYYNHNQQQTQYRDDNATDKKQQSASQPPVPSEQHPMVP